MKKFLFLILFLTSLSIQAFEKIPVKKFHRLVILDNQKRILVVKIKNTDFWVTPGLYSEKDNSINDDLINLASEYGLTIKSPILKGKFILINKGNASDRYFYTTFKTSELSKLPSSIEAIKWLSLDESLDLITFPHINILLNQIISKPETAWCASIERYRQNEQYKARLLNDFKPMEECN